MNGSYNLSLAAISVVSPASPPVRRSVSVTALFVLRVRRVSTANLLIGAGLMGTGIASMHYTGMSVAVSNRE